MSINKLNKQRFTPFSIDIPDSNEFENLLQQHQDLLPKNTIVKGVVIEVTKEVVVVDVGLKNEGRIPISEFSLDKAAPPPQVGDLVEVFVDKVESRNGRTMLSREKAIKQEAWVILEKAFNENQLVDGIIFLKISGGYLVDLSGVVAFLPASHLDIRIVKDPSTLMNIVQSFQILSMDNKLGNIVVSRRLVIESSASEARKEKLANIKEGDVLEGIVKNITNFGAFVDLGSVDGLLHITDISWKRINHPSEILKIGEKITVKVTKFDEQEKRISLGIKQIDESPWTSFVKDFSVGDIVPGKITDIKEYGAFVEINGGIEGLVPSAEISWTKVHNSPRKMLNIGQELKCKILDIDAAKHRISLSIKQCGANPWNEFAKLHNPGEIMEAQIKHITDFGLFVSLTNEIDGLIHISDISDVEGKGHELLKQYVKGDMVKFKLLSVDLEKERINLGIKQLDENNESTN
ncbi:MAG: 30S ribosomal protein S1 [Rickettsiaceae bacterium]|nr:30S ribosomal protein S1 [Rickettsiaceae bacterium]